jgi:formyl-CoA transferase
MNSKHQFSGIKVLEVSRVLASPFSSAQLAFLGAEDTKVEEPGTGDAMRTRHIHDPEFTKRGMSTGDLSQNANKKSITLNLRTPEGQDIFRRLVADSDVVIENLRTGTMGCYGLAYDDLRKINPRLIYCSVTAYGQQGDKRRHPAYDPVIQAASGMMSINGTRETAPVKIGPPVVDFSTGMAAAFAIASTLFQRERTGEGQHIDVSMLDMAFVLMGSVVTDVLTAGAEPKARGNTYVSHPTNASFPTRDGLIYIAAMKNHQLAHLWQGLERTDIAINALIARPPATMLNGGTVATLNLLNMNNEPHITASMMSSTQSIAL